MGWIGEFSGVGSWVSLTVGRIWPSVGEPPDADRQLALLPVGLLANISPLSSSYPSSIFGGEVKLDKGNKGKHYYHLF